MTIYKLWDSLIKNMKVMVMIRHLFILIFSLFLTQSFEFEGFDIFDQNEWTYMGEGRALLNPDIYKYSSILEAVYRVQTRECFIYTYHMKDGTTQTFSRTYKRLVDLLGKETVSNTRQPSGGLEKSNKRIELQDHEKILEAGGSIIKTWAYSIKGYGIYLIWEKDHLELVLKPV